jgi:hypothetical protein
MSIAMSGTMRLTALWPWMAQTYRLDAIAGTGGWSEVRCTGDAVTTSDLRRDSFLSALAEFHRLAAGRRAAFADITDWEDARSGRGVAWWSLWDIGNLRPFRDVYFLGNGLLGSLTCQLLRKWDTDAVVFRPFDLPATPPRCARPAVIHYFSAEPASSHWWRSTPEGRDAIARIVDWLRANAPGDLLWTANEGVREEMKGLGLHGICERPMLAGVNSYRAVHWVAMIYSAKLLPAEATAMRLFQLDRALIRQSREFEALIQFGGRGSIRDPKCVEPFHLAVYDQAQAEFVAEHLRKHSLASPVEVVAEDVGITRPVRQAAKPKSPEGQVHARVLARERQRKRRLLKRRLAASVSQAGPGRE